MAHDHYKKDVRHLDMVDVYRVLALWNVTDPCIQHAVKKLLVAGGRGAGKSFLKDIQEAIDSLERLKVMRMEDLGVSEGLTSDTGRQMVGDWRFEDAGIAAERRPDGGLDFVIFHGKGNKLVTTVKYDKYAKCIGVTYSSDELGPSEAVINFVDRKAYELLEASIPAYIRSMEGGLPVPTMSEIEALDERMRDGMERMSK